MIRCEQKGPHQQVRFRLALSVLPTAPGIISPVSPAHSPPPRALPSAREDYQLERSLGPPPWHPDAHSANLSHKDGHLPLQFSWSCPPTWDPSTTALESHNCLQSEPFWKPEDPHQSPETGQPPTMALTPHQERPLVP